jgi:hypothetical protein
MPLLLEPIFWVGVAIAGGAVAVGVGSYEAGNAAGQGIGTAATILGIAAGVGIVIYAMQKT